MISKLVDYTDFKRRLLRELEFGLRVTATMPVSFTKGDVNRLFSNPLFCSFFNVALTLRRNGLRNLDLNLSKRIFLIRRRPTGHDNYWACPEIIKK
jgi:hypothetical protein